jgi:hypothetical protein
MDKRSLTSKSVMVIRINIHPTGKEANQYVVRATPEVSRTTTVCEVPTTSKLVPCSRDEVLVFSDTRLGHHPKLPHSPSNKPPKSKVCGST